MDDSRFADQSIDEIRKTIMGDPQCVMVNRNQGSGTRILIDDFLAGEQPPGYAVQSRSHNAVAASIKQGRSDWGVAIEVVAKQNELGFAPLCDEEYDFAIRSDCSSLVVDLLRQMLADSEVVEDLASMGFEVSR